jgi:hypothetical protein
MNAGNGLSHGTCLLSVGLASSLLAGALVIADCSASQGQAVAVNGVDLVVCALPIVVSDILAGDAWSQCLEDAATKCGSDVATIATIYATHVNADVAAGRVPLLPGDYAPPDAGK